MKNIIVMIAVIFNLTLLFGDKSLPSEAVGFSTYKCIDYGDMDYHQISIPFQGIIKNSSEFDPEGLNFHNISLWSAYQQKWITSSFNPDLMVWQQAFQIQAGQSYMIHDIFHDFNFITNGEYQVNPSYSLIVNPDIGSMNLIMVPLEKYNLYWAGADLGNDIVNEDGIVSCSMIGKLDPKTQATRVTMYNGLSWAWDYPIKISDPVFVRVNEDIIWPDIEGAEISLPKAGYWRIVKKNMRDYDLIQKSDNLSFEAWITGREDDILTHESYGCGFEQICDSLSSIYINFGNFKNYWDGGDEINIKIMDMTGSDNSQWRYGIGRYTIDKSGKTIYRGFGSIKGSGEPIIVSEPLTSESNIPYETELYQNYPNPFNPVTTIKFSLKEESKVSLNVYNYTGQLVKALVNETRESGFHKIEFNASQFSSGVYYYTLKTDNKTFTKKMLMIK